jgi:hypothetical protein
MQLKLHAAKSAKHVSICAVGDGTQQQRRLTVRDNLEDIIVGMWEGCCSGRWRQREIECRAGSNGGGGGVEGK